MLVNTSKLVLLAQMIYKAISNHIISKKDIIVDILKKKRRRKIEAFDLVHKIIPSDVIN